MEPRRFYRVQSDRSFTLYDEQGGFEAWGEYFMNYCHWLTKGKIERHLDWKDRSLQRTPFISVFDNWADAERRAGTLLAHNHQNVFIAEIVVPRPRDSTLEIRFGDGTVELPVLLHKDQSGTTTFFAIAEAWKHLGVDGRVGERSEWLALNFIPRTVISRITPFN